VGIKRVGKRLNKKVKDKEIKTHQKEFFKILNEIDRVVSLLENEEITEDNLDEKVAIHSEMKMGNMERIIFKNKLKMYEE
jgi:hypothetical protein